LTCAEKGSGLARIDPGVDLVLEIRAATPLLVEKKAKDGHPKRNYKTLPTHPGTIELTEFPQKARMAR
jgi:hypothetical protein